MPLQDKIYSITDTAPIRGFNHTVRQPGLEVRSCSTCFQRPHCLLRVLDEDEGADYRRRIGRPKRVAKGHYLFRQSEPFDALFVVLSGSFKTVHLDAEGDEQIYGFQLSGDLLGLDPIGFGFHSSSAVALEDSMVCRIPCQLFEDQFPGAERLKLELARYTAQSLRGEYLHSMVLRKNSADQRLAMFLIDLSNRLEKRNYAYDRFHLSQSRQELGNYLALALETVCRSFSRLQDQGLIGVDHREITIHERDALEKLAYGISNSSLPNAELKQVSAFV